MNAVKKMLTPAVLRGRFLRDYARFVRTGRTSWAAFQNMRRLYCLSAGRGVGLATAYQKWAHPPKPIDYRAGLLGLDDEAKFKTALVDLEKNGFHVFERKLPTELCAALLQFASATPLTTLSDDPTAAGKTAVYDPANPISVKYDCEQQTLMEDPTARRIAFDPSLVAFAQAYFGSEPVQDLSAMWWSTPTAKASSAAAQLYHFDLDRIRFLKFFFYLTDVGPENGPHCYIRGSHRSKPRELLRVDRITDEEVFRNYGKDAEVEICGPVGSIAAVDTVGFHKGKPLTAGHRLIFQVEFSTDLFGYEYPAVRINDRFDDGFRAAKRERPYTYSNYVE